MFRRGATPSPVDQPRVVHFQVAVGGDAGVDPRLDVEPLAGLYEVPHEVALAAPPRRLPHAVGVEVGLPLEETAAMLGNQDGVLCSQGACRLEPLVGVELLRMLELRVRQVFP